LAKKLILTGDINLMNVADPAEPFRKIVDELHAADVVFGNLECCLHLAPSRHSHANEGFFADPAVGGEALMFAGIHAVGIANNVNYGADISRPRSRGSTRSASFTPARGPVSLPRGRPRSLNATGCVSASCSAARSTGRPTTRRATTRPA
jgi:hypothetical protein